MSQPIQKLHDGARLYTEDGNINFDADSVVQNLTASRAASDATTEAVDALYPMRLMIPQAWIRPVMGRQLAAPLARRLMPHWQRNLANFGRR